MVVGGDEDDGSTKDSGVAGVRGCGWGVAVTGMFFKFDKVRHD